MIRKESRAKISRSDYVRLARHPLGVTEDKFIEWCKEESSQSRLLALDLFSGAGGLGLGVEEAGWRVVASTEINQQAIETHQANFRGLSFDVDMSNQESLNGFVDKFKEIEIDLIVGGPPCQPFSRAGRSKIRNLVEKGKRQPEDKRKELWRGFVYVVKKIKPRAVIMENVPDIALGDGFLVVRTIAQNLEDMGYDVEYRLVDAWRYGVPQHRKRFFLVGRNDGEGITWPPPNESTVTVKDAISDLPRLDGGRGARQLPYTEISLSEFAREMRGSKDQAFVYDHETRAVRPDDLEAFKLMTSDTKYSDLPEHLRRYRDDIFNDKYKRLHWEKLSRTITAHIAKDGYWYIHPEEHRTLTIREAARIQTFPDYFRFCGTRSHAFTQIGNAVPPLLGKAIATSLIPAEDTSNRRDKKRLSVRELRNLLEKETKKFTKEYWWCFPAEHVTQLYAFIFAYLDGFSMKANQANAIFSRLKRKTYSYELLKKDVRELELSPGRKKKMEILFETFPDGVGDDFPNLLSPRQLEIYELIQGKPRLLVNRSVCRKVSALLELPEESRRMHTDIKTGLSLLLGIGDKQVEIMCGLLAIPEELITKITSQ